MKPVTALFGTRLPSSFLEVEMEQQQAGGVNVGPESVPIVFLIVLVDLHRFSMRQIFPPDSGWWQASVNKTKPLALLARSGISNGTLQ